VSRPSDVHIRLAADDDIESIRALWREYWTSFGLSDCFQDFASELPALPGPYAAPDGRLLIALCNGEPAGTAAFRRLNDASCEAKRLYVRPEYRGRGIGKSLLNELIEQARTCGYRTMYGDTLQSMRDALDMYRRYGFVEGPAYSEKPTPGAIYLRLDLSTRRATIGGSESTSAG
jgi:GNAT superfamily N-acetyltransferase